MNPETMSTTMILACNRVLEIWCW